MATTGLFFQADTHSSTAGSVRPEPSAVANASTSFAVGLSLAAAWTESSGQITENAPAGSVKVAASVLGWRPLSGPKQPYRLLPNGSSGGDAAGSASVNASPDNTASGTEPTQASSAIPSSAVCDAGCPMHSPAAQNQPLLSTNGQGLAGGDQTLIVRNEQAQQQVSVVAEDQVLLCSRAENDLQGSSEEGEGTGALNAEDRSRSGGAISERAVPVSSSRFEQPTDAGLGPASFLQALVIDAFAKRPGSTNSASAAADYSAAVPTANQATDASPETGSPQSANGFATANWFDKAVAVADSTTATLPPSPIDRTVSSDPGANSADVTQDGERSQAPPNRTAGNLNPAAEGSPPVQAFGSSSAARIPTASLGKQSDGPVVEAPDVPAADPNGQRIEQAVSAQMPPAAEPGPKTDRGTRSFHSTQQSQTLAREPVDNASSSNAAQPSSRALEFTTPPAVHASEESTTAQDSTVTNFASQPAPAVSRPLDGEPLVSEEPSAGGTTENAHGPDDNSFGHAKPMATANGEPPLVTADRHTPHTTASSPAQVAVERDQGSTVGSDSAGRPGSGHRRSPGNLRNVASTNWRSDDGIDRSPVEPASESWDTPPEGLSRGLGSSYSLSTSQRPSASDDHALGQQSLNHKKLDAEQRDGSVMPVAQSDGAGPQQRMAGEQVADPAATPNGDFFTDPIPAERSSDVELGRSRSASSRSVAEQPVWEPQIPKVRTWEAIAGAADEAADGGERAEAESPADSFSPPAHPISGDTDIQTAPVGLVGPARSSSDSQLDQPGQADRTGSGEAASPSSSTAAVQPFETERQSGLTHTVARASVDRTVTVTDRRQPHDSPTVARSLGDGTPWRGNAHSSADSVHVQSDFPVRPSQTERLVGLIHEAAHRQQSLRVRLHPPELGSLQIEVTSHRGVLEVRLQVQSEAAQRALSQHLHTLRETLAQTGQPVHRVDVQLAESQPHPGGGAFGPGTQGSNGGFGHEPPTRSFGGSPQPPTEEPAQEMQESQLQRSSADNEQLDIRV